MNYFEIFNKVLMELNYRPVQNFENIYKTEHRKILDLINRVNNEVLASYGWPFLERKLYLDLSLLGNTYELPFDGPIIAVYKDNKRLKFVSTAHKLLSGELSGDYYSVSENSLILEKGVNKGDCTLIFETTNYATDEFGGVIKQMTEEGDASVLPMPFAEHILVYGTCLKVKANPSYPKFGFWNTMYVQALRNLLQKSPQTNECEPFISLS